MRVFVSEYLCSVGIAEAVKSLAMAHAVHRGTAVHSLFASLCAEGGAMLSAVLEDFSHCPGVQTAILIDEELDDHFRRFKTTMHEFHPPQEEQKFRALARDCAWTLVIAPEFNDILARRCLWVEKSGGRLLGPSSEAVRLTADKLALANHWKKHGIPTPATIEYGAWPPSPQLWFPLVCKPRFGAGSQANFLVHEAEELQRAIPQAQEWSTQLILQPYCPGLAVSVAFLAGSEWWMALPAVEQCLSKDGRFHYQGGRLPLPHHLDERARRLAEQAARTVKGMHGYFGVDLVLGDADDGSADVAIEINPRLTTSYIGLRRLAQFNLAEALLATVTDGRPPAWNWRSEPVVFAADGRIIPLRSSRTGSP